jgi:hypothetical protein
MCWELPSSEIVVRMEALPMRGVDLPLGEKQDFRNPFSAVHQQKYETRNTDSYFE